MKFIILILSFLNSLCCYSYYSTRDDIVINMHIHIMDSSTKINFKNDFAINIDKYRICNVLIRSNQINKDQLDMLVKDILDSFPKLKVMRLNPDEFLYTNYSSGKNNKVNKDNLDYFITTLKRYNIETELYILESITISNANIINNTNYLIIKQIVNNIDKINYLLHLHTIDYYTKERLPIDLQIKNSNTNDLNIIYDSIELEVSNCNLLYIDILNGYKEKSIDTGDIYNPKRLNSKIKSLHIALEDSMHCKELVIQKPIGNLPITFNNTFKNSIEKITLWNPLCIMIPKDIFECKNLTELNVNLLGCKDNLNPLSKLMKLKKLSLYNCYNLSNSQQKELINCKNLQQIEELTITFCPSIKFLNKLLDKCKGLKKLNLDPNTLAMLYYNKKNKYSIPQNLLKKLNTLDSLGMILNQSGHNCDGRNPPLSCVVQNSIFNFCFIHQYFEINNSKRNGFNTKKYTVPARISKYLEIYHCLVNKERTNDNDYDLKLESIELFYSRTFKNFRTTKR